MFTYKIINNSDGSPMCVNRSDGWSIPFDPANSDMQQFKKDVLAGAELQDADGNVMTDAKDYVRTLP